jgi:hypothetical protein
MCYNCMLVFALLQEAHWMGEQKVHLLRDEVGPVRVVGSGAVVTGFTGDRPEALLHVSLPPVPSPSRPHVGSVRSFLEGQR